MGGNALKNTFTRRYQRDEYFSLEHDVVNKVKLATNQPTEALKAFRTKESFGDMDVLTMSTNMDYMRMITDTFSPNQIHKNGSVYSFDYRELQIDLIITPEDEYKTSIDYFAWNDLGNLMGRIYKKMGFKYGHKRLYYIVRDGDYIFKEILVSSDTETIFWFGGYDYARFIQGFDTLDEIFKYTTSSQYFNKDIFLFHNRNHRARVRDAKRSSYNAFLKYCETITGGNNYKWTDNLTKGHFIKQHEKQHFLELAFTNFPRFEERYNITNDELTKHIEFKKRFSGERVMYLTGLCRKELGEFMQFMKTRNNLKELVLDSNDQEITDFVLDELVLFRYNKQTAS